MDFSLTRARLTACLIVIAVAFAMIPRADAQGFEYRAAVGAGYTDNVRLDPINVVDESLAIANLRFSYNEDTRRVHADVLGELAYHEYLNNTYDPEMLGNVYADASFSIVPDRFVWLVTDGYGQVLQDPFRPPNPGNRQNLNYLTTGPDFFVGLGSQFRLRLGARYSLATYEDDPFDSTTTGGEVGLMRIISDRSALSLNGRVQTVKYKDETLNADFDQSDVYLQYESQGARTNLSVQAGYGMLDRDVAVETDSGPHVQVDVSRLISESSVLSLMLSQRFDTAASEFADNLGNGNLGLSTGQGQQTFEPFTLDEARLGWTYSRHRTTMSAFGDWADRDYQDDPSLNQTLLTFGFNLSRNLSPTVTLDFSAQYTDTKYPAPAPSYNEFTSGVGCIWRLSRSLVIEATYDYYDRKSDVAQGGKVTENRLQLTIGFGRGEPRRTRVAPHFGIESIPNSGT